MCFGIKEFAFVTSLRCVGLVDKKHYANKKHYAGIANNFMSRYFTHTNHVYKSSVKMVFDSRGWETDEDAVKCAKLYLLQNFLLGPETIVEGGLNTIVTRNRGGII